jgi:hypothetical protein
LYWIEADTGGGWSCGLVSDGTVRCWGTGTCSDKPRKTEVFTDIAVGEDTMCAIRADGTVGCWCCDAVWDGDMQPICQDVPAGTFQRVEVAGTRACAQDLAGVLTCWGGPAFDRWNEQPAGPVSDYAMDANYDAAVLPDGTIVAWGTGNPWREDPPADVFFTHVSTGTFHACGLDVDGTPLCWGDAAGGPELTPFPDPPAGVFAQIPGRKDVTCVIDALGTSTCWWGGLPPDWWVVPLPAGVQFAQIGLSGGNACGVSLTGEAYCWGSSDGAWLDVPSLEP